MKEKNRDIKTLVKEYDQTVEKGKSRINRIYLIDIPKMYSYVFQELGIEKDYFLESIKDTKAFSVMIECIINSIKYGVMLEKHTTKK